MQFDFSSIKVRNKLKRKEEKFFFKILITVRANKENVIFNNLNYAKQT